MNSGCWLNNAVPASTNVGQPYINTFANYVTRLVAKGFAVIIELHWSLDPGELLCLKLVM